MTTYKSNLCGKVREIVGTKRTYSYRFHIALTILIKGVYMTTKTERLDLAGKTVKIKKGILHPQVKDFGGSEYHIEGYWDEITGGSWMFADGNPACLIYAIRTSNPKTIVKVPIDDEVLYGKVGIFGHLVHISEIENTI